MRGIRAGSMTGMYALIHLAVDLACAFLIYAYVLGGERRYLLLLAYNFCAFALQMPIGVVADRLNRNSSLAAFGCAGVLAGLWASRAGYPASACLIAGVGNACFHVGAGLDVLNSSGRKAAPLGMFVAPGALGVYLGGALGRMADGPAWWIGCILILSVSVIRVSAGRIGLWHASDNAPVSYHIHLPDRSKISGVLAVSCFLTAVILRSYSGMVQAFPWKSEVTAGGWILTAAVALGKMAGGLLGDKRGVRTAAFWSMGAAAAGFLFKDHPAAGILAVFCWNMSMPLTLWAIARIVPGAKGFGFGLLSFGLFVGFCPVCLEGSQAGRGASGLMGLASSPAGLACMAVVALILLGWGLRPVTQ